MYGNSPSMQPAMLDLNISSNASSSCISDRSDSADLSARIETASAATDRTNRSDAASREELLHPKASGSPVPPSACAHKIWQPSSDHQPPAALKNMAGLGTPRSRANPAVVAGKKLQESTAATDRKGRGRPLDRGARQFVHDIAMSVPSNAPPQRAHAPNGKSD